MRNVLSFLSHTHTANPPPVSNSPREISFLTENPPDSATPFPGIPRDLSSLSVSVQSIFPKTTSNDDEDGRVANLSGFRTDFTWIITRRLFFVFDSIESSVNHIFQCYQRYIRSNDFEITTLRQRRTKECNKFRKIFGTRQIGQFTSTVSFSV